METFFVAGFRALPRAAAASFDKPMAQPHFTVADYFGCRAMIRRYEQRIADMPAHAYELTLTL